MSNATTSGTTVPDVSAVTGTTTDQLPEPQVPGPWFQACARQFREHPHLMDLALAAGIYLLTVLALIAGPPFGDAVTAPGWAYVVAGVTCGALVFRRTHPWVVLVVTAAGYLVVQFFSSDVPPLILAVVTALATVTLAGQRRWAILAAVTIMVCALALGWITEGQDWSHPRPVAIAALCALAIALADATRNRRAYVAAIEERARRAEASREQDALRRVADERLRIARDLHDVLAHHIAVINVQAGVAGHLMEQRPEQARVALDHVRAAARSVLAEMQAVLTVLRDPGEGGDPAEPAPGIGRLDALLDRFRTLGLSVDLVVSGVPAPLPAAVDLVAYRVAQESLTNVRKHAGRAAAEVRLGYLPSALEIVVTNSRGGALARHSSDSSDSSGSAGQSNGGFGLIGMRERVNSVGGDLRTAPTADGGFIVTATLPFAG